MIIKAVQDRGVPRSLPSNTDTTQTERGPNRTRGSRFAPADFEVTPKLVAFATGLGLDERAISAETAKFKDHEFKTPKKNWVRTWRNWIRGAAEYRQQNNRNEILETTATLAVKFGVKQRTGEPYDMFAKRVCDADTAERYGINVQGTRK